MIVLLMRYLLGFVRIKIYGEYPERFLNIAALNDIKLWGIKKQNGSLVAFVSARDFIQIRPYKKRANVRIKLLAKYGLWFNIKPYKNRFGIPVGIAVAVIINFVLSRFIWNIEITGNEKLSVDTVIAYCSELGIGEGTPSSKIDTSAARLKLLMRHDDLSWASFIIEGSHLTVNVSETVKEEQKNRSPANFVAEKDGVIEKVTVSVGKATVKIGEPVTAGDLIATGAVEYTDGSTALMRCQGEILAKTKGEKTVFVPFQSKKSVITGRSESRCALSIFNFKFPFNPRPLKLKGITHKEKKCFCRNNAYLPIYFYKITVNEKIGKDIVITKEKAQSEALKALSSYERRCLNKAEILSKNDNITATNKGVYINRKYILRENIARLEKIKISTVQNE